MTLILHALFYISMGLIWFLVAYQFFLTLGGLTLFRKSLRERETILDSVATFPKITILVPAHNEEKVIARTVQCLLGLNYPKDRLDLLVIDDASTDKTLEILHTLAARDSRLRIFHRGPEDGGKGKAAALNAAMEIVDSEFVAIYDADNCPEPNALKLLMARLISEPELGAVVGKFRTGNKRRNVLTRFINIEGLCFQNVVASGRCQILGVAALSGTNYVIRRSILQELGGWDIEALAEDSELSIRMYQAGHTIAFVPYSVTWEQEPETMAVWLKQRTRWARGNNYAIAKLVRTFGMSRSKVLALEMLFTLSIPYLFLFAIVVSQLIFVLGLFGVQVVPLSGVFGWFWFFALLLYMGEMALILSYDDEHSWSNIALSLLMYFSYCQAWLIAVLRALYLDCIIREKRTWDKTVRFDSEIKVRDRVIV
ncbi:MAG TPA: glycosyltransferase [Armatimonadota bacterium]|jgi:cellulose synthase/poly-beta-1,6-N-acetylglucosamine synthase-like glycosyltransferase